MNSRGTAPEPVKYYFQCPNCGSDEEFVRPSEQSSDLQYALWMFGGFLPSLLYSGSKPLRVQCMKCLHIFPKPPIPGGPLGSFAGWILGLTVLLAVAAGVFASFSELGELLPPFPVIDDLEIFIAAHPHVTAYFFASLIVLLTISCAIAVGVSNFNYRRELKAHYRLRPISAEEYTRQQRLPPAANPADGDA